MGGFTLGSHIDHSTGAWNRSAVDVDVLWFSNLLTFRRNRIRQFLALNYTQGWNRKSGYEESIGFTDENGLQALDQYAIGTNRMVLNTETVMFTPIQPWGFRFAFFGFLDAGTLGYSANPFRNDGFASFGLGLRIKNERLIFGTDFPQGEYDEYFDILDQMDFTEAEIEQIAWGNITKILTPEDRI